MVVWEMSESVEMIELVGSEKGFEVRFDSCETLAKLSVVEGKLEDPLGFCGCWGTAGL